MGAGLRVKPAKKKPSKEEKMTQKNDNSSAETTPKVVTNKRLLHLLGAFLLSDEITFVKPETELESVKDLIETTTTKMGLTVTANIIKQEEKLLLILKKQCE